MIKHFLVALLAACLAPPAFSVAGGDGAVETRGDTESSPRVAPIDVRVRKFFSMLRKDEEALDIGLSDSIHVAAAGYRLCTARSENNERWTQGRAEVCEAHYDDFDGAVEVWRSLEKANRAEAESEWALLIDLLSEAGKNRVSNFMTNRVIPETSQSFHSISSYLTKDPRRFETWKAQCEAVDQEAAAGPNDAVVVEHGRIVAPMGDDGRRKNVSVLRYGTPAFDRQCLRSYAHIVEPGILDAVTAEYAIATTDDRRVAFVESHAPSVIDGRLATIVAGQRRQLMREIEALRSLQQGLTVDEAFDHFSLEDVGHSKASWRRRAQWSSGPEIETLEMAAVEIDEKGLVDRVASSTNTYFRLIEHELSLHLCGFGDGERTELHRGYRTKVAAACRQEGRSWYVDYAKSLVPDSPVGWELSLKLFRSSAPLD